MESGRRILLHTSIVRIGGSVSDPGLPRVQSDPPPAAVPTLKPWQKIRIERVERNLTASELADRSGVTLAELNRIETGELHDPPLIHRLDRALGTSFFNEYLTRAW